MRGQAHQPVMRGQVGAANQRKKKGWGVSPTKTQNSQVGSIGGSQKETVADGEIRRPTNPIPEELAESAFSSGVTKKLQPAPGAPKLPK